MSHQNKATAKAGNGQAELVSFQALYARHWRSVLASVLRRVRNWQEAEEITATAFEQAFAKRSTFRGDCSFSTWVHAIAFREIQDRRRRLQPLSLETIEGASEWLIDSGSILDTVEASLCRDRMHQALRRLPKKTRRALVGRYLHGDSVREIARREQVPYGTVLSRVFAGKQQLRRVWKATP
jgi:RNA polymerase sigma-70 factor (ECF subfamily)